MSGQENKKNKFKILRNENVAVTTKSEGWIERGKEEGRMTFYLYIF